MILVSLFTLTQAFAAIDYNDDRLAEGRICEYCEGLKVNQEAFALASREQRRKMAELRETSDRNAPEGGSETGK